VETTEEMAVAVGRALPSADVLFMAAAPADFRPVASAPTKLPRAEGARSIGLEPTTDILQSTLGQRRSGMTVVGFALETGNAVAKGRAKLERKSLDMIVVNDATEPGAGFDVDTNIVTMLDRKGGEEHITLRSKREVAEAILDAVERYRG
jgi:phosphopantothenoylcysteine decarboxylase/phosphopantothenate--cysteine ligase